MEKRSRGRPRKDDNERRTEIVEIRVSPLERKLLDEAMGDESLATWAREVILRAAKRRLKSE